MAKNKSERIAARRAEKRNQELKTLLLLGAAALLIIAFAFLIFNRSESLNAPPLADTALLVREDSPSLGPQDAPVTLVEFIDPECEACRAAFPIVKDILADYENEVRFVVRYFPNHYNSVLAIAATEAAGQQGKYWEMQETLFANQLEWGERSTSQADLIIGYAAQLGLDMDQFLADIQDPAYAEKAMRDRQDGLELGVRGTPTFYVDGQVVFGMDEPQIRHLIEAALP